MQRYLTANALTTEFHASPVPAISSESETEEDLPSLVSVEPEFDFSKVRHKGQFALRKLYHETDRLLVVLYTSPSCGPCRTLKPMVSTVVNEFGDGIHYVEIDIETDPEIAEAAGVMGTPTLQCFSKKERVESVSGVKMKSEWRKLFSKYAELPSQKETEQKSPVSVR